MLRLLSRVFLSITSALLFGSQSLAESARPDLQSQFFQNPNWTGADGAYSVDMGNGKAIWLFSDTFIGPIINGKRPHWTLVNTSIGIQDINAGKMEYFWVNKKKPESYFAAHKGYWLWLGDGAYYKNKLYCFAKRICSIPGMEGNPYGFSYKQDELISIDNPKDNPAKWHIHHRALKFTNKTFHVGTACLVDGKMLYVMGLQDQPDKTKQMLLARVPLNKLQHLNTEAFEFLHNDNQNGEYWSKSTVQCAHLFDHAAAEASLSKVGTKYVCVLHSDGLGARIVARTAQNVTGPWSAEKVVYTISDDLLKRGNCYAGKGHPEQLCHDGSMMVTYLVNPGTLEEHDKDPTVYYPRVVEIKIPD